MNDTEIHTQIYKQIRDNHVTFAEVKWNGGKSIEVYKSPLYEGVEKSLYNTYMSIMIAFTVERTRRVLLPVTNNDL